QVSCFYQTVSVKNKAVSGFNQNLAFLIFCGIKHAQRKTFHKQHLRLCLLAENRRRSSRIGKLQKVGFGVVGGIAKRHKAPLDGPWTQRDVDQTQHFCRRIFSSSARPEDAANQSPIEGGRSSFSRDISNCDRQKLVFILEEIVEIATENSRWTKLGPNCETRHLRELVCHQAVLNLPSELQLPV